VRDHRARRRIAQGFAGLPVRDQLDSRLEAETGQSIGFRRNGSIAVATGTERMTELRRAASTARSLEIEAHELAPAEVAERWPFVESGDKEDAGKLLVGAYEPVAKPWGMQGIPQDFCFSELPEDLDHFMPVLEAAIRRVPLLATAGIGTFFNGPESFTPDDSYLLGEAPELGGLFLAAGFNSVGIQSAPGAGLLLADWIRHRRPPPDIWEVDIRRTFPFQSRQAYIEERVTETLGLLYAMHWPYRQYRTARGVLKSPLHETLDECGACFGEAAGWERANWFATAGMAPVYKHSYGCQNWFECSAAEHRAVREAVGLFDQSSFAKFEVAGVDAEAVLQRVCTNDVAAEPGRVVYTQWLNERGGIEADVTVTRLAEDRYRIVTGPSTARRDWIGSNGTPPAAIASCVM
jgi:hypothetical protein